MAEPLTMEEFASLEGYDWARIQATIEALDAERAAHEETRREHATRKGEWDDAQRVFLAAERENVRLSGALDDALARAEKTEALNAELVGGAGVAVRGGHVRRGGSVDRESHPGRRGPRRPGEGEDQVSGEDYDPKRTVTSLAAMLGWGNTPPRQALECSLREERRRHESEVAALKAALTAAERERDEARAERDAWALEAGVLTRREAAMREALRKYEQASPRTPHSKETTPCFCGLWPHTIRCLSTRAALSASPPGKWYSKERVREAIGICLRGDHATGPDDEATTDAILQRVREGAKAPHKGEERVPQCGNLPRHTYDPKRMCCPYDPDSPVHK